MRSALELASPTLYKFAFMVEHNHRVRFFAGSKNRVMNVDMTLRILADTVRVPVLNIRREFAPVVCYFVGVISRP